MTMESTDPPPTRNNKGRLQQTTAASITSKVNFESLPLMLT